MVGDGLKIDRPILKGMIENALGVFPNEACGLLASLDGRAVKHFPLHNVDESPVQYRIDPSEQLQAMLEIDNNGWDLGAIYHSHTHTRAYPSATDIRLATYPDALYIIISLANRERPDVRAFHIRDGVVSDVSLEFD